MSKTDFVYVRAVAECRNFTKAAQELFIAQPSLSRYIKNLEDKYGVVFFDRTKNPLEITKAGKRYLEYASQVDMLYELLIADFSRMKSETISTVRLGIPFVLGEYLLPKVLTKTMKSGNNIAVSTNIGFTSDLLFSLKQGKLDLTIAGRAALAHEDCHVEILTSDPLMLVALKTSPFLEKYDTSKCDIYHPLEIDFDDIRDSNFGVGKSNMTLYSKAIQYLTERNVNESHFIEVASLPVNMDLALSGNCISFVMRSMLKYSHSTYMDLLCPISCGDLNIPICLAYMDKLYNEDQATRTLVKWIREEFSGKEI